MRDIEIMLRAGMTANGYEPNVQDQLVKFISAFADFGFPESHAASFAKLAEASAFLKVRYLAAFVAALLNNWPMGFYHPATIVKDAQRHGLRVKPIDAACSQWNCSLEREKERAWAVRVGLRYVRGLSQASAEALVRARAFGPFASVQDLTRRVPELSRNNLAILATIGALNNLGATASLHRRDALWQVEKAVRKTGPLLEGLVDFDAESPLRRMEADERLAADYHGMGLTTGPHAMAYCREILRSRGVKSAMELRNTPNGKSASVAGCVIVRQMPGSAKGFMFMTLEDETGTARVIINPDFFRANQITITREKLVLVYGFVQNQDNTVHLKAQGIKPLSLAAVPTPSRDFH
jgi:error-prone DNA polymerase